MSDPNKDKEVEPVVIDQKVVPEKKSNWLWWILALIILLLLIYWFMHRNQDRTHDTAIDQQTTTQTVPAAATATGAAAMENNTTAMNNNAMDNTTAANSQALAINEANPVDELNTYFTGTTTQASDWIDLTGINFDVGSATPQVEDQNQLDQVIKILNDHPNKKMVIRGYTDSTGPDPLNQNLSTDRAKAIQKVLVDHKIKASRLSIEGEGSDHPIATNETAQGRELNRRVAIKVLE